MTEEKPFSCGFFFFQLVVADFGFVRIDLSINLGLLPVLQPGKTSKPTNQSVGQDDKSSAAPRMARWPGPDLSTVLGVRFLFISSFLGYLNLKSRVSRVERYCYSLCGFKSEWNRSGVEMAFRFVSFGLFRLYYLEKGQYILV